MHRIKDLLSTDKIIEYNLIECEISNEPFAILKPKLLDSVIELADDGSSFYGDYYPTIGDKISFVVTSILKNHYFMNGNKRTAFAIYLLLCKKSSIRIKDSGLLQNMLDIVNNPYDIEYTKEKLF